MLPQARSANLRYIATITLAIFSDRALRRLLKREPDCVVSLWYVSYACNLTICVYRGGSKSDMKRNYSIVRRSRAEFTSH